MSSFTLLRHIRLVLQRYSNLDLRTARLRANAKQFNCKTNLTCSLILQEAKGFAFPLTATQFPLRSFRKNGATQKQREKNKDIS